MSFINSVVIKKVMPNEVDELQRENARLKSILSDLVHKAEKNELIHKKFSDFEIELLSAESIEDFLMLIVSDFPQYFDVSRVTITIFDPEETARELIDNEKLNDILPQLHFCDKIQEIHQEYPKQKQVTLFKPTCSESHSLFGPRFNMRSVALLPLIRHHFLFGSIHLGSLDPLRFDSELATDFLRHLASVISVCFENVMSQQQLKMLSQIDVLTRVKNRRYFNQGLTRELTRAHRLEQPISCLFVDLDFFKKINDTYGHQAGDRTLKVVAKEIQKHLRKTDLLARFGGEEFVVLLPYSDSEMALQTAERIRANIQELNIKHESHNIQLTASFGATTWAPKASEQFDIDLVERSLIHSTDIAVYRAKELGRNCVITEPMNWLTANN
jgi:two-component system, cell cycle response regulator